MKHLLKTATSLAVLALATPTQAELVTEEFEYGNHNVNNFLANAGADGGSGWADPWHAEDGISGTYWAENLDFAADGYDGEVGGSWAAAGAGVTRISREFATPFDAGSTVWGSFLIQSTPNGIAGRFNRHRILFNNDADNRMGFGGVDSENEDETVQGNLDARVNGQTTVLDSAGIDAINLFVVKMEIDYDGGNDRLTVWTNPAGPLSDEASLGAGDVFDPEEDIWGSEFTSIGVNNQSVDNDTFIDAIRFSDDPDDGLTQVLTGVPEPASSVLIGLGGLALLRRRRGG